MVKYKFLCLRKINGPLIIKFTFLCLRNKINGRQAAIFMRHAYFLYLRQIFSIPITFCKPELFQACAGIGMNSNYTKETSFRNSFIIFTSRIQWGHLMRKEALSHSLEVTCGKWTHRGFGQVQHQTARNGGKDHELVKFFNYRAVILLISHCFHFYCSHLHSHQFSLAHSSVVLIRNRTADKHILFQEGMLKNQRDCVLSYLAFPKLDIWVRRCDDIYISDRSHFNKRWQKVLKFHRTSSATFYIKFFLGNTQYKNCLLLQRTQIRTQYCNVPKTGTVLSVQYFDVGCSLTVSCKWVLTGPSGP
jgi:hypothetical protein